MAGATRCQWEFILLMTPPVCSNPGCYAQRLCDCRGPVNREHYVSQTLLKDIWQDSPGGSTYGLTFIRATPNNPAQLGIKNLTAKILCEMHNRALSPFDTEMAKLFWAMERVVIDEIQGDPVAVNSYVLGDRIERWMYKTLCGGVFSGNFPVPFEHSFEGQLPSDEALQIIFRNSPFPDGEGIYLSHEHSRVDHHVFRLAVVGDPTGIVGLRMWVFGSLFTLVLTGDHTPFPELKTATYRPPMIIAANTRNAIRMSWEGDHSETALQLTFSDNPPAESSE